MNRRGCAATERGGGFTAGDTNNAEHGHFAQRGTRDKDAFGGRIQIRRSDLHAVIEQIEQIVGDDAFKRFSVAITQPDP